MKESAKIMATTPDRLPVLVGFRQELLPYLLLLWAGIVGTFAAAREPFFLPVTIWATVTSIMLWPVGRRLGRGYFSYRTPLFAFAVVTMAWIIATGFVIESDMPFDVKSGVFFTLPIVISVLGIVVSLKWAIARPIEMFFRPDLLFGDGRVLAGGILSMVLGMRYLFGAFPADMPTAWPIPAWNWYALLLAIGGGFVPMIAGRGMIKLVMRLFRMRDDRLGGWIAAFLREFFLVITALGIGYGFHNVFAGTIPFTHGFSVHGDGFWPSIAIMAGSTFWIVAVRSAYKKLVIGDPFIKETIPQAFLKHAMLAAGLFGLFYGFISFLHQTDAGIQMGIAHLRTPDKQTGEMIALGTALCTWGIIVLIPFRVLAQHYQRQAMVAHMAAVIVPHQTEAARKKLMGRIMIALSEMREGQARSYMKAMIRGLASASADVRALMTRTRVEILAELPKERQAALMRAQAGALQELDSDTRVQTMSEMMSAVSQLPTEKRRGMMEQMSALMA